MPLDAVPSRKGDFFLFCHRDGSLEAEHHNSKSDRAARARQRGQHAYTSHFATCPNAAQHRLAR
jgi:hypothetical protein